MGGVIKSGDVRNERGATHSIAFNLEDMNDRANGYLAEIRHQAASLLAETRKQADRITEQAKEEGRQAALREAEQQLEGKLTAQLATLRPAMEAVIRELDHSKQAWMRHWENGTIALAIAIAERVARREITTHPEITLEWIREALTLSIGNGGMTIHVNPRDHQALADRIQDLIQELGDVGDVKLVPDAEISLGGCRVTTQFGEVDQQLESQLARIQEELSQ